jgi:hypothetical protein
MDKLEYRSVIKFLTLEGEMPKNIPERMTRVYGDMCPSRIGLAMCVVGGNR